MFATIEVYAARFIETHGKSVRDAVACGGFCMGMQTVFVSEEAEGGLCGESPRGQEGTGFPGCEPTGRAKKRAGDAAVAGQNHQPH